MIESWAQYTHLEKLYGYLPGMDEALLARLFGLDPEEYREVKGRFDANAHEAALELLEDASFAESVDRLPHARALRRRRPWAGGHRARAPGT
jgi:hypothetical protein